MGPPQSRPSAAQAGGWNLLSHGGARISGMAAARTPDTTSYHRQIVANPAFRVKDPLRKTSPMLQADRCIDDPRAVSYWGADRDLAEGEGFEPSMDVNRP